jgi:hypothetical protein
MNSGLALVERVPRARLFPRRVKCRDEKCVELYLYSPIHIHGVIIYQEVVTTLP